MNNRGTAHWTPEAAPAVGVPSLYVGRDRVGGQ
jgi:hypothetical protein